MPFFKDAQGALHYLSSTDVTNAAGSGLPLPAPDWAAITDDEAAAIQNPPLTVGQAQAQQIALLEAA